MKHILWLALPLSIFLTGCSEENTKSEAYYYDHPQEAQDVFDNCQFSDEERETSNCKNASQALNKITGEALMNR